MQGSGGCTFVASDRGSEKRRLPVTSDPQIVRATQAIDIRSPIADRLVTSASDHESGERRQPVESDPQIGLHASDRGSAHHFGVRSRIGRYGGFTMKISNKPLRFKRDNAIYFLTFCTYRRAKVLLQPSVPEMLIENLRFYGARLKDLIAYTVMPDHIHLMVEIEKVKMLSDFLRDFKKRTSRKIRALANPETRFIWQRGTRDHYIRPCLSQRDFDNHINYLFSNSWKHLGNPPRKFPYHNLEEAIARGFIPADSFPDDAYQ